MAKRRPPPPSPGPAPAPRPCAGGPAGSSPAPPWLVAAAAALLWSRRAGPRGTARAAQRAPRDHRHAARGRGQRLRATAAASTPVLDALAARGARFTTAVAHVPLTGPSHASILTGLIPVRHGVRDNGGFVLPDEVPVLTERFRGAGYRTAAFVSGYPLVRRFGFGRGFETYDDSLPHGQRPAAGPPTSSGPPTAPPTLVLRWLEARAGGEARRQRRALVPLGPLLRPARAVRAARGARHAVRRAALLRRGRVRGPAARAAAPRGWTSAAGRRERSCS